jgi:N-acetylneuraminic acid mutarotase
VGFSIGNKGYVGTGLSQIFAKNDFWEYDPATDTWTQKADYGGEAVFFAVGFAINGKGYIGEGQSDGNIYYGFWEYDPILDTWTQVADFPGKPRAGAVAFSIGDQGYLGTGGRSFRPVLRDFWEFTPQ